MRTQINPWIHLFATTVVVAAGFWFNVTTMEWCVLLLAIGLVWTAEALNTAIEFAIDLVTPDYHELAGKSKDIAAGAVLLASIVSASVGLIIFWPHFASMLGFA